MGAIIEATNVGAGGIGADASDASGLTDAAPAVGMGVGLGVITGVGDGSGAGLDTAGGTAPATAGSGTIRGASTTPLVATIRMSAPTTATITDSPNAFDSFMLHMIVTTDTSVCRDQSPR